jgi:hypothetical protein
MKTEQKKSEKENKPVVTFRAGVVSASVWKKTETINKKDVDFFNVTLVKNYKDKEDEWKSTSSFNREDLVKARLVLDKAIEYIYLKEE